MSEQVETKLQVPAGFSDFYRDHFKRLTLFMIMRGASPEEAQDAVQEGMKAAIPMWSQIDSPQAYVRTASMRIFLRGRKRAQREHQAAIRGGWQGDLSAVIFEDDTRYVLRLLDTLSPNSARCWPGLWMATPPPRSPK